MEDNAIEPRAREAQRRFAAVVASSSDAILTKSAQGIITSWNAAAERLYGYTEEEAVGRPISILIPSTRRGEEREILRRVMGGETIAHYETERVRKDGDLIIVSLSVSPVRDADGAIVEAAVIARDISATRRMQRQRERLQAVSSALSEAIGPEQVVDAVLTQGFAAVDADAAVVALTVPGSRRLRLLGMRGYRPELARQMRELTVDSPLPLSEAIRTGRPVWIEDGGDAARRYPDEAARFELERESVVAALPLIARGHTIGALGLRFRRAKQVDADERAFMVTLAHQCAQAVERARLFDAEQRARRHAEEARRRAEYLARASALLTGSLNPAATLAQVARLAVPELADWAFVELLQPNGEITREVIAHRDPARERWAHELAERYPLDPDAPYGSPKVIRTGEAELLPEITDEMLEAVAADGQHLDVLRELGLRSGMVVPLRARGRVLGDIALARGESGRRFDEDDLAMAQQLADRCAVALDNARLFAERSYIAKTLQEGLLPAALPDIPRVELAVEYRAGTLETDVGGDFYDVFAAGDSWLFVAGDVVGKGAKAAAITGLARHTLRAAAQYERSPADMLRVLNRAMLDEFTDDEQFCTVAIAALHGEQLRIASGGHPLPLVLRCSGDVHPAGRPGALIGVLDDPPLHDETITLAAGDTVVLYTDGITDAQGPHGRFGAERLAAVLAMLVALPPAQVIDRIDRAASAYRTGDPADDSAIVAFRLTAPW
jgi:PAS domain S-box-containing protein